MPKFIDAALGGIRVGRRWNCHLSHFLFFSYLGAFTKHWVQRGLTLNVPQNVFWWTLYS